MPWPFSGKLIPTRGPDWSQNPSFFSSTFAGGSLENSGEKALSTQIRANLKGGSLACFSFDPFSPTLRAGERLCNLSCRSAA